jgi:hypothetical protein
MIADGEAQPKPQNIDLGRLYLPPVKYEKDELRRRLRRRMKIHHRDTETQR